MTGATFYCSCVNWPREDVSAAGGLCDMINHARMISRRTFLANVEPDSYRELETDLGYARNSRSGLSMARDWAVSYHKSKLHGETVYYIRHSAIEYVFAK